MERSGSWFQVKEGWGVESLLTSHWLFGGAVLFGPKAYDTV